MTISSAMRPTRDLARPADDANAAVSFFAALGERIAREWRGNNHDERAFSALAVRALHEQPPAAHVRYLDVVDALLFSNDLPPQPTDLAFGQPPIIVFSHPRFSIEVLCWMDATTTIHQHAFSGAFHVLQGSSVHTSFAFEVRERINGSFLLGDLQMKHSELLRAGDTRAILPGRALIHGLFHLDAPSISVVVRTRGEADAKPQYEYLPPFVAFDPFLKEPVDQQRLQLLTMLLATDRAAFAAVMGRLMFEADLPTVFQLLHFAHLRCVAAPFDLEPDQLAPWVLLARDRFGARVDDLLATVIAATRIADIQHRRADILDVDHRFFLALLMNVPNQAEVLRLVQQRYEGDPFALVLRWLWELTREVAGDLHLLDAVIGGGEDESAALHELLHAVLAEMLAGAAGSALVDRVSDRMPEGFLDAVRDAVPALEQQLRAGALHALFVPGTGIDDARQAQG